MVGSALKRKGAAYKKFLEVRRERIAHRLNVFIAGCPPKPHLTTNFRSSRYGDVFAETRKVTPEAVAHLYGGIEAMGAVSFAVLRSYTACM